MNTLLASILVTSMALLIYHHLTYPIVVSFFAAAQRAVRGAKTEGAQDFLPSVTILVPAHNEERVIGPKLVNLLQTDYPADRLAIVIVLDGCTDDTRRTSVDTLDSLPSQTQAQRAKRSLRVYEYPSNVGKVAVLNQQISQIKSDIVVLSDASASLSSDAVRRAVNHFSDPKVGVVAPTYKLVRAGREGEQAYTDYLTRLRRDEGELDSPLGCHGACYLFRRNLWQPMAADTINDDFILPMQIIAGGYRGVYDTSIVAVELETSSRQQEFRRRVRLGAGNMQQSIRLARLLNPRRPWLAFTFASGKWLRAFMPFVALAAVLALAGLAACGGPTEQISALCGGMAIAALLYVGPTQPRILAWAAYLIEGYAASLVGAVMFLAGRRLSKWQPNATIQTGDATANLIWPDKS